MIQAKFIKKQINVKVMNSKQRTALINLIDKYAHKEGLNAAEIPNVFFFKSTTTGIAMPSVYAPSLCIIVQGAKQVTLEEETYYYAHSDYLIVSVDLPVVGKVTTASPNTPYLAVKIDIDMQQVSELLLHTEYSVTAKNATQRGIFIEKINDTITDSVLRLLTLLDSPEDIPILAQQTLREIYYRVLRSEYGQTLAKIAVIGSHMQRIAHVINILKLEFQQQFNTEELANMVGMSVSSFYSHFKSVTSMSPLQFQKKIRLMEARNIMIAGDDAASAAYMVGYESSSQFSREYARMFGNPPARDISLLKEKNTLFF